MKKRIIALWSSLGEYYRQPISDMVLMMYAEDVADLPPEQVEKALFEYRRNPKNKFPPLPAHIREAIQPSAMSDDQRAVEVAARIVTAISKFGWNNTREARAFMGEIGWAVVEKQGGWENICANTMSDQIGIFQAQVRELAKVQIKLARMGALDSPPQLPKPAGDPPARIGTMDALKGLLSQKNDF